MMKRALLSLSAGSVFCGGAWAQQVALPLGPGGPAQRTPFVADRGVSGNGVSDDSAYLNNLIATYGSVYLPCGTYLIKASPLLVPSNSAAQGAGACSIIKASSSLVANSQWPSIPGGSASGRAVVTNSSYAGGNSSITLTNLTIDASDAPSATFGAAFYNVSGAVVENVRFIGSGTSNTVSALAFVNSSNYRVANNYSYNFGNVCFDNWQGDHDFEIVGNICDGNNISQQGIAVNGAGADYSVYTTYGGSVVGNRVSRTGKTGIQVSGSCTSTPSTSCGIVRDIAVTGNTVETTGEYGVWGGDGLRLAFTGNIIKDTAKSGLYIGSQGGLSTSVDMTATGNKVENASNGSSGTYSAIQVGTSSESTTKIVLNANTVTGTNHRYAIQTASGVTGSQFWLGPMTAGTLGMWSDSGTTNCFNADCAYTSVTANYTMLETDTFISFGCAASCTLTLLDPATHKSRNVCVRTTAAQTVVSASSNVIAIAGGAAGTAILAATAGKFACLQSNGSFWITKSAN